jgi:hypothetical protein
VFTGAGMPNKMVYQVLRKLLFSLFSSNIWKRRFDLRC